MYLGVGRRDDCAVVAIKDSPQELDGYDHVIPLDEKKVMQLSQTLDLSAVIGTIRDAADMAISQEGNGLLWTETDGWFTLWRIVEVMQ